MRSRSVGLGYDEGTVLIKVGREEPVASMDASGKIIWARHNEVQTVNVKAHGADFEDVRPREHRPHCRRPQSLCRRRRDAAFAAAEAVQMGQGCGCRKPAAS